MSGAHAQGLPGADWRQGLEPGQKLRARIVYVDAAAKRVCLSLLPHLVAGRADPAKLPPLNSLYEARSPFPPALLAHAALHHATSP
jgi:hypothetical protein